VRATDDDQNDVSGNGEVGIGYDDELSALLVDGCDGRVGVHADAVLLEFGADERAEVGIDRREDSRELLDDGDVQSACAECFGHLEADVAGTDDRGALRSTREGRVEDEAVADRVQLVDPFALNAGHSWPHRLGAGRDDQRLVAQLLLTPISSDRDCARVGVDPFCGVLEQQLNPCLLEFVECSVSERVPVGNLAGEEVGQPADREVRIAVGEQHRDLDAGIDFAGAQGGADAGVAAADDEKTAQTSSSSRTSPSFNSSGLVLTVDRFGSSRMNW
jgi:hypothetical protein